MQRIKRMILSVLLIAAVLSGTAVSAAATDLPAGLLISDQDGIHVTRDGEYFINADGLEAGDVITKRLVIHNTEPYSFNLSMTAEPLSETGPLRLLNEVRCTLRMDGRTLYDGRVRGDDGIDMIRRALDLGSFRSGDQKTLEITLTVHPEMKAHFWSASEAFFKWHFYAAQDTPIDDVKTGERIKNSLYFILPGIVFAIGILVAVKRRRRHPAES